MSRRRVGTIDDVSGPPAELVFQELSALVYPDAPHCEGCSRVDAGADARFADGSPSPTFDVSKTLDGAIIATQPFRDVCDEVHGIRFAPLAGLADHWLVEIDHEVQIDPFDSHISAGPLCSICDRPRYVVRSGPIRLQDHVRVPDGFSQTDVAFGDTADFGPDQPVRLRSSILVDRGTARLLKAAPLLGIHLITQP